MRMRPASLIAAAPPSSCQVTHRVRPIDPSAATSSPAPIKASFAAIERKLGLMADILCAVARLGIDRAKDGNWAWGGIGGPPSMHGQGVLHQPVEAAPEGI